MIKVGCVDFDAHQFKVEEELILVIDEVFEIAKQNRQRGFALFHKGCGNSARQILIREMAKSFFDMGAIVAQSALSFDNGAGVIDGQFAQLDEVREPVRMNGIESSANAREAFQQVAE